MNEEDRGVQMCCRKLLPILAQQHPKIAISALVAILVEIYLATDVADNLLLDVASALDFYKGKQLEENA